jgi:hypothetical protein
MQMYVTMFMRRYMFSTDETESMFGQLFEVDSGAKIQTRVIREMPTDADNEVKGVAMAIDRARPDAVSVSI